MPMRKSPPRPRREAPSFEAGFAVLRRHLDAHFADPAIREARDGSAPTAMAADPELFRAQLAARIEALLCRRPECCADHRCRRQRRCRRLADGVRLVEEQRARVARETERPAHPTTPAVPPMQRRRGKKARDGTTTG